MNRAEKFRRLLADRGWSQARLAKRAGLKTRSVAYAITGNREPGVVAALRIARTLDVDAAWLFDDAQDWPPSNQQREGGFRGVTDAALMQEALSRKRAAKREFEDLYGVFLSLRSTVLGGGRPSRKVRAIFDRLEAFAIRARTHAPAINAWLGYGKLWDAISIFPNRDSKAIREFDEFLIRWGKLTFEDPRRELQSLLDIWGVTVVVAPAQRAPERTRVKSRKSDDPAADQPKP